MIKLIGWLIESGCSVNAKNSAGQTPLHVAIYTFIHNLNKIIIIHSNDVLNSWFGFHIQLVRYLLYKGADAWYIKDSEGLSAIDLLLKKHTSSSSSSQLDNIIINTDYYVSRLLDALHSYKSFHLSASMPWMRLSGYSYLSLMFSDG